ncbi:hypothetical protein JTB14_012275 [Gonioctena quinquepunctata]|nr:hypothetical protein JTB14_012275 [Gonioctena quinquepunctata]
MTRSPFQPRDGEVIVVVVIIGPNADLIRHLLRLLRAYCTSLLSPLYSLRGRQVGKRPGMPVSVSDRSTDQLPLATELGLCRDPDRCPRVWCISYWQPCSRFMISKM